MDDPLILTREVPARPTAVFDAWTTPSIMRRWLFASDTAGSSTSTTQTWSQNQVCRYVILQA